MAIQGLKVLGGRERASINATGQIGTEFVISIQTDDGNTGDLIIPLAKYNAMDNDALEQAIIAKAIMLDRASRLVE